jgi:hypothetical protein
MKSISARANYRQANHEGSQARRTSGSLRKRLINLD